MFSNPLNRVMFAGIAAVRVDATGHVGAQRMSRRSRLSPIAPPLYCYKHGTHFVLAYRLYERMKAIEVDLAAIAAKLEELSDPRGVGLTPHAVALAAVAVVNETIDKMGSTDELQALNRAFKKARAVDPSIKYVDYLEARKAAMLETLAREVT